MTPAMFRLQHVSLVFIIIIIMQPPALLSHVSLVLIIIIMRPAQPVSLVGNLINWHGLGSSHHPQLIVGSGLNRPMILFLLPLQLVRMMPPLQKHLVDTNPSDCIPRLQFRFLLVRPQLVWLRCYLALLIVLEEEGGCGCLFDGGFRH